MTREELSSAFDLSLDWIDEKLSVMKAKWDLDEAAGCKLIACMKDRYGHGMPTFLRTRNKQNELVPVVPTPLHLKFKKYQRKLSYCVKPRQVWFTTFMGEDYYLDAVESSGKKVLFINLDNRVTEEVFDRVKVSHENHTLPAILPKERRNTTRKLSWDNGGSYDAITCKNDDGPDAAKQLGRSCTVQRVHVTEAAYMRYYREFVNGLMDSKPVDAYVCFESTGNGAAGGWYEDCMEIHDKGEQIAPNVWVLGDKSLHFFGWWEHPEYKMERDPLPDFLSQMGPDDKHKLEQSEQEHLTEMRKDPSLTEDDIRACMNWRRWRLFNEKGFLRDPDGAILAMDREYPAKLRHAFSTSGSAFLSLSKTDIRSQEAKARNKEEQKPIFGRLIKDGNGVYSVFPGSLDIQFWELPVKEKWKNRYCIGSDVGGGNSDSDPDCIWVKDRVTNAYVAVAHSTFGPIKNAEIMQALGYFYQTAWLCHEVNNHGIAVSIQLWEDKYPKVYKHDKDGYEWRGMGFRTGEKSRREAINLLKTNYEDKINPPIILYEGFYKEATAFSSPAGKPDGKIEGQSGVHDDTILSAAITETLDQSIPDPELEETKDYTTPVVTGYSRKMGFA